jgi:translation initiation factor 4G
MLDSRSGSGRRGLGPAMMDGRDDSGNSPRTGTIEINHRSFECDKSEMASLMRRI